MDPVSAAGIALSVIGLFPLCATGFEMIKDVFDAPKDIRQSLATIFIQSGIFIAWGECWGISRPALLPPQRQARGKSALEIYLTSSTAIGPHVLATLIAISDTFSDVRKLEREYGVVIRGTPAVDVRRDLFDPGQILEGRMPIDRPAEMRKREVHMNLLRRAKFVLTDSKGLKRLTEQLESYNDALLKMCSERTAERVERAMINSVLSEKDHPEDLGYVSWAARQESFRKQSEYQRHAVYDLLAATADFKIKIKTMSTDVRAFDKTDYVYERDNRGKWGFNNGEGTMAISERNGLVRFVEWKYYRQLRGGREHEDDIRDIKKLASILCSKDKPVEIRTLDCIGIFKDPANSRYGFLYQPPKYIAVLSGRRKVPGEVSKLRKPTSLLQLLKESEDPYMPTTILDLGVRFRIAKQLVQSVYVLHAAGWVHKNIRARSLMFLPAESSEGGPSRSGRKNYENPWFSGFGRSRSEDPDQVVKPLQTGAELNINLDIYQHPEKRNKPSIPYKPIHDIYSLGCVLLEIGLWQSLESFDQHYTPDKFQRVLLDLTNELVGQIGAKYAGAVRECLSIRTVDLVREGIDAQQVLCWKVAAVLDQCSA